MPQSSFLTFQFVSTVLDMVLFENINVNQRVEVLRDDGNIHPGTVRYKGCINGIRGEWVGVELDCPGKMYHINN